jgi:O-antigen/teichoic acid export membrane protein
MSEIAIPADETEGKSVPGGASSSKLSLGVQVFQNTAAQLGGRVIGIFLSAGTSILLARYLGKEKLGEYGAIYAYLSLYGFFATFCLEQILAREVSVRREQAAEIFRSGTLAAMGFSVLGTVVALVAAPLFGYAGQLKWLIAVAALDMLILPPLRFRGIIFQVEMKLWYTVATGLLRQALWLAAVVLLALKHAAFYDVIIARTAIGLMEAVVVLWTVKRAGLVQGTARFNSAEAQALLGAGFPLVLTTLASGIYHRIDQVMLHKMSGDVVLGPYVIAVQLTELFSTLPIALMNSLFPALAQTAKDEEKFKRYLAETYRFLLVVVFAACALVTPVAAPVIQLFYGKEYLPTANLLIVLIWSEVPIFFAAALGSALIAKNLQRYMPIGAGLGAVMNIVLNLIWIPKYGAMGASWATVISYSFCGIFYLLLISETRPMVMVGLKIAVWPFLLSVGITAAMTMVHVNLWWKLAMACLAYLVGGWISGMITKSDIERLAGMFRQGIA